MSNEINNFRRVVRNALQNAPTVWTPQCPEPETLLDWVEQGEAHPQAAVLLDHLLGCAYCRRERAALSEIRALSPFSRTLLRPADGAERIKAWASELVTAGFTTPVTLMRTLLESLERLAAPPALAATRSAAAPTDLQPASTVVRMSQPTLRWSAAGTAHEFRVVVARQTRRKTPQIVWEGSAGAERQLTLPEQASLIPGSVYLWQVTARTGQQEAVSAPASLAVLPERSRRQVEALEQQTEEATLERIGLYEAFGLYDEARGQAEMFAIAQGNGPLAQKVQSRLRERLAG